MVNLQMSLYWHIKKYILVATKSSAYLSKSPDSWSNICSCKTTENHQNNLEFLEKAF